MLFLNFCMSLETKEMHLVIFDTTFQNIYIYSILLMYSIYLTKGISTAACDILVLSANMIFL